MPHGGRQHRPLAGRQGHRRAGKAYALHRIPHLHRAHRRQGAARHAGHNGCLAGGHAPHHAGRIHGGHPLVGRLVGNRCFGGKRRHRRIQGPGLPHRQAHGAVHRQRLRGVQHRNRHLIARAQRLAGQRYGGRAGLPGRKYAAGIHRRHRRIAAGKIGAGRGIGGFQRAQHLGVLCGFHQRGSLGVGAVVAHGAQQLVTLPWHQIDRLGQAEFLRAAPAEQGAQKRRQRQQPPSVFVCHLFPPRSLGRQAACRPPASSFFGACLLFLFRSGRAVDGNGAVPPERFSR